MGYTTWNPADKSASIILSNGNLTAEKANVAGTHAVRSITGVSSGKWYWEVTIDVDTGSERYNGIGIGTSDAALNLDPGHDANGYGYWGRDGKKYYNAVGTAFGSIYSTAVIGIALDMDAGKIWWSLNGVWQASGNPGAGTNEAYSGIVGTFYAMYSAYGRGNQATANFGASAFAYTVPSGFHSGIIEPIDVDSDIANPSAQAQGYTGITVEPSIPVQQVQGYTGIYSAPSVPMTQIEGFTGITAEPSISMPTVIIAGHDNITHAQVTATIPFTSVKLTQAKQIWSNIAVPSMKASLTERETTLADVLLPMATVELSSGIHANLEATSPMVTADGLFSNQAEISIPMMDAEIEGKIGVVISSAVKVPGLTVKVTGKTEHLANCDVSAPMARVNAKLMTGKIITGTAEIPMTVADLSSYEDITGDINVSISMVEAYIVGTAERVVCTVLRYDDKPDVLGSIAAEIPMIEVSLAEV